MFRARAFCAAFSCAISPAVWAGENPLYQPAPVWVTPAALPDQTVQQDGSSPNVLLDLQQRAENGQLSSYVDTVSRIASPEQLAQMANVTIPWVPDKGDLIVHELSILRGSERIDLLAKGQRFTVLRREQALEQRELTGILSATLAVEGLQVGDLLRVRLTTTARDNALGGNVQSVALLPAEPFRIGEGRVRFSWPIKGAPSWKVLASGVSAKPVRKGDFAELIIPLPIAKQPEMPGDAPQRFRKPPLLELSTFKDWADVSKVFAPLYVTEGATGPISEEIAKIIAAEPLALGRAHRALQLVQDKVRYLAVGMDGGNYVPQSPGRTWELRYGDCKAKTLLLLTLLHAMKIEAEPVLAHIGLGDLVSERLPSAIAFNHVLVRATIDGETIWLDGTGSGSRLDDIRDTPPWRTVLPVRAGGAQLMTVATRANARAILDLTVDADESASTDIPTVFNAKAVIRGPAATQIMLANTVFGNEERRQAVSAFFKEYLGEPQVDTATITPNADDGSVTLAARGVATTAWYNSDRRRKRNLGFVLNRVSFSPDRSRPAWTAIPVSATELSSTRYRLNLRLPDGGRGYLMEGEESLKASIAGYDINRSTKITDGFVVIDERVDGTGEEVSAAQIPAVRDAFATAVARLPIVIAPLDTKRRWELNGLDPKGATQVAAAEAILSKAIKNDPSEMTGYQSRASFRVGIGNRAGALSDLAQTIKIEPSVDLYLRRAAIAFELGDTNTALADAQAARALDPGSEEAVGRTAYYLAARGELDRGISLLDERIALGGTTKADYQFTKANLFGEYGDPEKAIALLDSLILNKPGSPGLLNARCWIKGTRNLMLDTALKDCTSAIELSESTAPMLDSRAMIWFRLGRFDDALRDLDAVLASAPAIAQSRFLRGVILTRLGRNDEALKELAVARQLDASIDKTNTRYGVKP